MDSWVVVLGSPTSPQRSATMVSLLDQGFGQSGSPALHLYPPPRLELARLVATTQAAQRTPATPSRHAPPKGYTVQVGSFSSHAEALRAVRVTVGTVGGVALLSEFHVHGRPMWRGEVVSLTRATPASASSPIRMDGTWDERAASRAETPGHLRRLDVSGSSP